VGPSRLVNRNVTALRGRTSMRLEPELWVALEEICRREKTDIGELVKCVEQLGIPGGRTSAVRVYVLRYFKDAATEAGHQGAGHGALQPDEPADEIAWQVAYTSPGPIAA
jgi:predicted DNA-binding ribbon-helix-helix protein